nr:unnamed protein product [Callosobruchus analis]
MSRGPDEYFYFGLLLERMM